MKSWSFRTSVLQPVVDGPDANRGGSWNNDAANCRTASRNTTDLTNRTNNSGFRLALGPSDELPDAKQDK